MNTGGLVLVVGALLSAASAFIWLALQLENGPHRRKARNHQEQQALVTDAAKEDVEHIFNDTFREELRNRGRLHFEKILSENAMFLQQDLRLTTSQLNEYMKEEITKNLQDEFAKYEQSITDAKQLAIESIQKTNTAIEEQRAQLGQQVQQQ